MIILDLMSPEAFEWRRFGRIHIENAEYRGTVISPIWGGQTNRDEARPPSVRLTELKAPLSQLSGVVAAGPAVPAGRLIGSGHSETLSTAERLTGDASLNALPELVAGGVEVDEAPVKAFLHEIPQRSLPFDREAHMQDDVQDVVAADLSTEDDVSGETQPPCISSTDLEKASSAAETPDLLRRVLTSGTLVYFSPPGPPPIVRAESQISAVATLLEDGRSFCLIGSKGAGKETMLNAALARSGIRHVAARAEVRSKPQVSLLRNQLTRGIEAEGAPRDLVLTVPLLADVGCRYLVIYDLHHLPSEYAQKLVRTCNTTDSLRIAATSAQDLTVDGLEMLRRTYSVHDLRWIAFTLALQTGLVLEQGAEAHLAEYAAKRNGADTVADIVGRLQGGSLEELARAIQLFEHEHRSNE